MIIKLEKEDIKNLEKASKITGNRYNVDNKTTENELLACVDELLYEIEQLKSELRDLESNMEENYRPIPLNEQYEVYDSDFI